MFSRPKILFLVSLLFVALLNPKFNPYLLFKFLIFYHFLFTCQTIIKNGMTSCQINYMYIVPMIMIVYNVLGNGDLCA